MRADSIVLRLLLLAGCALLACTAHAAVMLDSGDRGQVLIFPYYTVNAGEQTLLSIVNPTPVGKAVKLRFRERLNGRETLALNLYLGAFDVWSATLVSGGDSTEARLLTGDTSCSVPRIHGSSTLPALADGSRYLPFSTAAFAGAQTDSGPSGPQRTREGFFEAIEMGTLVPGSAFGLAVTAVGGIPRDCAALEAAWRPGGRWAINPTVDLLPPGGQLYGSASIVDPTLGTAYDAQPTALSGFSVIRQHTAPAAALPDLGSAVTELQGTTVESAQLIDGRIIRNRWPAERAIDAVSALLARSEVSNEFDVDPARGARSDWILTFPTKRHYVDALLTGGPVIAPFTITYQASTSACERIFVRAYDRETRRPVGLIWEPPGPADCLCHSTTQIAINRPVADDPVWSNCRPPAISTDFGVAGTFLGGWLGMGLSGNGHRMRPSNEGQFYLGLPAIGFWKLRHEQSTGVRGQTRVHAQSKVHDSQTSCLASAIDVQACATQ